jgi:hypothetical protein
MKFSPALLVWFKGGDSSHSKGSSLRLAASVEVRWKPWHRLDIRRIVLYYKARRGVLDDPFDAVYRGKGAVQADFQR